MGNIHGQLRRAQSRYPCFSVFHAARIRHSRCRNVALSEIAPCRNMREQQRQTLADRLSARAAEGVQNVLVSLGRIVVAMFGGGDTVPLDAVMQRDARVTPAAYHPAFKPSVRKLQVWLTAFKAASAVIPDTTRRRELKIHSVGQERVISVMDDPSVSSARQASHPGQELVATSKHLLVAWICLRWRCGCLASADLSSSVVLQVPRP